MIYVPTYPPTHLPKLQVDLAYAICHRQFAWVKCASDITGLNLFPATILLCTALGGTVTQTIKKEET